MSANEPQEPEPDISGQERSDSFRARRENSPTQTAADDDTGTRIIRREPADPIPTPLSDDTRTSIIRREPSGPIPRVDPDAPTGYASGATSDEATGIRQAPRRFGPQSHKKPSAATAMAAATLSILNGWATSVIATSLITGWWRTDKLFCVGVGFLTAVFAAATIGGVIALMLRRRMGMFLTLVAAVLAVMIFAGIFVTGARVNGVVRGLPALPVATAVLVLLAPTWRWTAKD